MCFGGGQGKSLFPEKTVFKGTERLGFNTKISKIQWEYNFNIRDFRPKYRPGSYLI